MAEEEQEDKTLERAMVVVAHADDAEFGCSGTVAKWCAEGVEVVYVICTDGSKGTGDRTITSEELSGDPDEGADRGWQGAGAEGRGVPRLPGTRTWSRHWI